MDSQRAGSVLSRPASFTMPLTQQNSFQHLQRNAHQIHQTDRQLLEDSLKRSITLVFWYKPLFEPIRLTQEISTFPLFQLAQFSQLVSDLGVNPSGYVDSYNPYSGHWEQQAVSTVRAVESEQRLLYRIRKSFLEGLTEDECPGLREEVGLQMRPPLHHTPVYGSPIPASTPTAVKRPAPDSNDQSNKYYRLDYAGNAGPGPSQTYVSNNTMQHYAPPPPSQGYPTPPSYPVALTTKQTPPSGTFTYAASSKEATTSSSTQSSDVVSFPHHPHPPLKRWPNDYTVSEVSAGFKQMDSMIAQQPTLTQKTAFEKVFGCRYVKSTVCRHRGVWRRADDATKSLFESMGTDERAVWGDFVKQVEGRRKSDGQITTAAAAAASRHTRHTMIHEMQFAPGIQMIPGRLSNVSPSAGMGHSPADRSSSEYQAGGGDNSSSGGGTGAEVADLDEPVMGSLGPPPPHMHQNSQLPPDDPTSQQQTLGIVDSSLTHISQSDRSEQ